MPKNDEEKTTSDNCKKYRIDINILPACEIGETIGVKVFDGKKLIAWLTHVVNSDDKEQKSKRNKEYINPYILFASGNMKKRNFILKHYSTTDDYQLITVSV